MTLKFSDKRILITGASKGLGKAASIAFEKKGARLALVARSEDKLEELKNSFDDSGKHMFFKFDLLDSANIQKDPCFPAAFIKYKRARISFRISNFQTWIEKVVVGDGYFLSHLFAPQH